MYVANHWYQHCNIIFRLADLTPDLDRVLGRRSSTLTRSLSNLSGGSLPSPFRRGNNKRNSFHSSSLFRDNNDSGGSVSAYHDSAIMGPQDVGCSSRLYKILVIGEVHTGKSAVIRRYVHNFFSENYRYKQKVNFSWLVFAEWLLLFLRLKWHFLSFFKN